MRPNEVAIVNYLYSTLKEHPEYVQRFLFFIIFIPLIMLFFILEWDFHVLVFILLGYSSAFVGFYIANKPGNKENISFSASRFNRLAVENSKDIIIFTRIRDGKSVFVSQGVFSILGYEPRELTKQSTILLIHPGDRKKIQRQLNKEAILLLGDFSEKVRVITKNGGFVWMELSGKLIQNEFRKNSNILISLRDISSTMELEKATEQLAEELRRKQHQSNRVAEHLDLNTIMTSHDLKEPLRTVKSYVQLFDRKHLFELDEEGRECIHYIKDGVDRMQEMIEDIQAFSSLEKDRAILSKVPTNDILKPVLRALNAKVARHNAVIVYDGLPEITADPKQFQHLFLNLIDNAIKYNENPKPIIRISCTKERGNWLFQVKDNGIGINPEFKESIFNLFRRLNARGKYNGSGVGLAICKKIAENHNGSIWMESEGIGKGSTFFIQLPVGNETIHEKTKVRALSLRKHKFSRVAVPSVL